MRLRTATIFFLGVLALRPVPAGAASSCLHDAWDDGSVPPTVIFPNWTQFKVATHIIWIWEAGTAPENIKGITIANFGSAAPSDITRVYMKLSCGATTQMITLAFAGTYSGDSGPLPAWTWAGTSLDFSGCADLCGAPYLCGATVNADIYVDIDDCPTPGATVQLGFPSKNFVGGITDNYYVPPPLENCFAASGPETGSIHTIQYVYKEGPKTAAPGDTVDFTIYYGRPGNASITGIRILDSIPQYTHYVDGSGSPSPDSGWDPSATTPKKLLWTFPGPFSPTGGPTGMITFQLSVDWGNGDSFESGSGDVAAPEGARLANRVHGTWLGSPCSSAVSNQVNTTVKRFMMWLVGDNDVLFSPSYGQPPDEMIYSVFVKNISETKTWWDVRMWDTVPPVLDPWGPDCGFDDPCQGWTMTPSGCAAASPGRYIASGKTILTWKIDMPPGFTLGLRWKAKVSGTAMAGQTAINIFSLLEFGHSRIVDGTGYSTNVNNFAHLAPIILPTTYISYVAYSGDSWAQPDQNNVCDALNMFPLNKKTQFELRGLRYIQGWASTYGVSSSIGCLLGSCVGGFPGSPGSCGTGSFLVGVPTTPSPGTMAGCKAERIPARWEAPFLGGNTAYPYQDIYKITSNSPVDWQSEPGYGTQCGDWNSFAPSTTLTFTGLLHYFWKNSYHATVKGGGAEMWFQNTGKDPYGNYIPTLETTVHEFMFNYATLTWDYLHTYDLGPEGGAMNPECLLGDEGPYRSISSQGQLIVWQGYNENSYLGSGCPYYDCSAMAPTRKTGNTVGKAGDTFYGVCHGYGTDHKVVIGNVGGAAANVTIYQYVPDDITGPVQIPVSMRGSSGTWALKGMVVIPAGFTNAGNPRSYNTNGTFFDNPNGCNVFKVDLDSGGPIQIFQGGRVFVQWGGGAVLSAITGDQTGTEFWGNWTDESDGSKGTSIYAVDVFCSQTGMAVRAESETGISATYTTTGPDQCISFGPYPDSAVAPKKNFKYFRVAGTGDLICQFINDGPEKGYTAPFLQTGVHYAIILPPVVYSGQSFWITVIVLLQGGATKCDYNGTTSFSSTDPTAKIETFGMDTYNYTWKGATDCGVKIFFNVSFTKLGLQSVVAIDTVDGSISGVAATMVVGANVQLTKQKKLTVAASGDNVQFEVCWQNMASATAFSFTITDAIPMGTNYYPELASNMICWSTSPKPAITVWYSTATTTTPPATFTSVPGTGSPLSNSRWLRWTVRDAYVGSSGCVCYKVSVN